MTKQMKIATGLLAGAAVGTAIILALKSDKNDVLKQKVSDWISDLLARSKDKLGATSSLLHNSLAKVKA